MYTSQAWRNKPILGTVKFRGIECNVVQDNYVIDFSPCIVLTNKETHEKIVTVTVYIKSLYLEYPYDHVAIKNSFETEGLLDLLIEANIISEPVDEFHIGSVTIYVCKLHK